MVTGFFYCEGGSTIAVVTKIQILFFLLQTRTEEDAFLACASDVDLQIRIET